MSKSHRSKPKNIFLPILKQGLRYKEGENMTVYSLTNWEYPSYIYKPIN